MIVHREPVAGTDRPTFRVQKIDGKGATVYDRAFVYRPVPIDRLVIDSIRSTWIDFVSNGLLSRAEATRLAPDLLKAPPHEPPISSAVISNSGEVWLKREHVRRQSTEYVVLDASGVMRARLQVPANVTIRRVLADHVFAVLEDSLGVPYVVRYRIIR